MVNVQELATLRAVIMSLLNLPASQQLLRLNSNRCERAYEAYVFSLCCEAVRRAGGTVQLTGIRSGSMPNPVVFRGAPGSMASRNQDFAYANCYSLQWQSLALLATPLRPPRAHAYCARGSTDLALH